MERTMNSKYLSTPVNISRFIEMSSRSISPQREISQMTPQLLHPQRKTNRDTDTSNQGGIEFEDPVDRVGQSEMSIIENTAHLLQCGSPLYDPVKECWHCWNSHEMRIKERAQYGPVDGVSCDFCGFTDWLEKMQTGKKRSTRGMRRGKKRANTKETYLYHCDVCGMDLCTYCAMELQDDCRYHTPCMQCRRCHVFMRDEKAVLHRCYAKLAEDIPTLVTPSLSSASGGASSSLHVESVGVHVPSPASSVAPSAVAALPPSSPFLPFTGEELEAPLSKRPNTVWEVCVAFKNTMAHAKASLIAEPFAVEEVETPEVGGQLLFRTRTKLAAEELSQRFHDAGLFSSLRRFRV